MSLKCGILPKCAQNLCWHQLGIFYTIFGKCLKYKICMRALDVPFILARKQLFASWVFIFFRGVWKYKTWVFILYLHSHQADASSGRGCHCIPWENLWSMNCHTLECIFISVLLFQSHFQHFPNIFCSLNLCKKIFVSILWLTSEWSQAGRRWALKSIFRRHQL